MIRGRFSSPSFAGRSDHAVLLNYTATAYHWGCHGTSLMLLNGLVEKGYAVTPYDVLSTHNELGNPPSKFSTPELTRYWADLQSTIPPVWRAINNCDLLVCRL